MIRSAGQGASHPPVPLYDLLRSPRPVISRWKGSSARRAARGTACPQIQKNPQVFMGVGWLPVKHSPLVGGLRRRQASASRTVRKADSRHARRLNRRVAAEGLVSRDGRRVFAARMAGIACRRSPPEALGGHITPGLIEPMPRSSCSVDRLCPFTQPTSHSLDRTNHRWDASTKIC